MILVQAAGKYEETKIGAAVEASINLILSLILIIPLGLNGVIIGTLVANVFRTVQYALFASKNILKFSRMRAAIKALWLIATVAIVVLIYMFGISKINFAAGWLGWIVQSIVVFIVACIVVLAMSFIFYRDCLDQLIAILLKRKAAKA